MKKTACALAALLIVCAGFGFAAAEADAREALIDDIVGTAQTLYEESNGRWHRAESASDKYVCKNYTTQLLFLPNAMNYRMAGYPDVPLEIPLLNKETDDGYAKGIVWEDLSASAGNPFEIAAQFRYDGDLSKAENWEIAREFMMQVMRGDFFQMYARYYWGTGAHSLVFIENYDPEFQTVRWTDSHMIRKEVNGIDYGRVQFDAVEDIDWFVDAFCQPSLGATLYRLREDIVFAGTQE